MNTLYTMGKYKQHENIPNVADRKYVYVSLEVKK